MTEMLLTPDLQNAGASKYAQFAYNDVISDICKMRWETLDTVEVMQTAKAYYYFSIQFRDNLEIACQLHPHDKKLQKLWDGECDTDNLSPWPGVAAPRERLDHAEFVRRLLLLEPINQEDHLGQIGRAYLEKVRTLDDPIRAASISSYEDGGLSRVFAAMLRAPAWHGAGARAFRFFLEQHIQLDSDDDNGHGTLARHLRPSDEILPLWIAFRDLLAAAVTKLEANSSITPRAELSRAGPGRIGPQDPSSTERGHRHAAGGWPVRQPKPTTSA